MRLRIQMPNKIGVVRIGISGWRYEGWRGKFYPPKLPQRQELAYASRVFNSIEINGSFYSLQLPSSYQRWYAETPDDFLFSLKGPRYITHMKRLRDVRAPLANFFASGLLALRQKLGPILWQFPPHLQWDEGKFTNFFELLPHDTDKAARLAKHHDDKIKARAFLKSDETRRLRYAIEIRHSSFMVPEFFSLLRGHNIAFVFADTAKRWPYAEDLVADFAYVRLHGDTKLYVSGYGDNAIAWWANRIGHWLEGRQPRDAKLVTPESRERCPRDVFVYFDNDAKVRAPFDAQRLDAEVGREM